MKLFLLLFSITIILICNFKGSIKDILYVQENQCVGSGDNAAVKVLIQNVHDPD